MQDDLSGLRQAQDLLLHSCNLLIFFSLPQFPPARSRQRKPQALMLLQQLQQLLIQLMPMPVGIVYIGPPGIENAEIADEIPQREPNPVGRKYLQDIREPRNKNSMRGHLPTTAFAAMDADPLPGQLYPGLIIVFQY